MARHAKLSYDCGTYTELQIYKTSKFSVIKHKFYEIPQNEHFVSDLDSWEQFPAVGSGGTGLNVWGSWCSIKCRGWALSTGQYDNSQHCKPVSAKRAGGKILPIGLRSSIEILGIFCFLPMLSLQALELSEIRLTSAIARTREDPPPLSPWSHNS